MKSFFRVMLGKKSVYAATCALEGYVGLTGDISQDLTEHLPDDWREFNAKFRPVFLGRYPEKTNIGAGLACGYLWTVAKGIKVGDVVLCPDGQGAYHVGEVSSGYYYEADTTLPHRRRVNWFPNKIDRAAMSDPLKNSSGSVGTVSNLTTYASEIELLIAGQQVQSTSVYSADPTIVSPTEFALEKHLEDFLVKNWQQTEIGKHFDIYTEEGELVGQQYQTDTGPMDILAIKKDKSQLLVVELKKGRASDAVVGQVLRYMGYVKQELAEHNQEVKGVIIALEDDTRIRRALSVTPDVSFYRYEISFKLHKVD